MVVGIIKKYTAECFHSAGILCVILCITQQNLPSGVNIVRERSPSQVFRVLLISKRIRRTQIGNSTNNSCYPIMKGALLISTRPKIFIQEGSCFPLCAYTLRDQPW